MKNYLMIVVAGYLFLATACSKKSEPEESTWTPVAGSPLSVETQPANSSYKPAFEGQTRVAAVKTATAISATVLTSSLTAPWGIAALPRWAFPGYRKGWNDAADNCNRASWVSAW
jgi:hypothetical protein